MKDDRTCCVCGGPLPEGSRSTKIFCSNRCKQEDKYWSDPQKYRDAAKAAYYKPKGESK